MNIEVVNSEQGFQSLRNDWDSLNRSSQDGNIFKSWSWQYSWWKEYHGNAELHIIKVTSEGEPIAILPLYIQRKQFIRIFSVNTIRLIGTGGDTSPDYLGIIGDSCSDAVIAALSNYILSTNSNYTNVVFSDIECSQKFFTSFLRDARNRYLKCYCKLQNKIPYIEFPSRWNDYLLSLSSNRRSQIRRDRRKLEKKSGSKFYVLDDINKIDMVYSKLVELHQKRWDGRSADCAFSTEKYINFHYRVIREYFASGVIKLFCLEVDKNIIAILYCYKWGDTYYYFQGGFDPEYAYLKPGSVLMSYSIEYAINDNARKFDMLKGDYGFKRSLTNSENESWCMKIYTNKTVSKLLWLRFEILPKLKTMFLYCFSSLCKQEFSSRTRDVL